MQVETDEKKKIPAPWWSRQSVEKFQREYIIEPWSVDSNAKPFSKQWLNDLMYENGEPYKASGPPFYTKEGWANFTGETWEKKEPKEKKPFLFTPKGWSEMRAKYGVTPEFAGPFDMIGIGTRISFPEGGFVGPWFSIDPPKEKKKVKVMKMNEETGKEEEVEETIMVGAPKPAFLFSPKGFEETFQGSVQREYFNKALKSEDGKGVFAKNPNPKVLKWTNDGDFVAVDKPTGKEPAWFSKQAHDNAWKSWKESEK